MAYWINDTVKVGNARQLQFYMDADADVANLPNLTTKGAQQGEDEASNLPCGKGSTAFSIGSGSVFILNSSNVWTKIGG